MSGLLILVVLVFVVGIVLINQKPSRKNQSREQFLEEFAKYLEGPLEPIADQDYTNSFRIPFHFKGEHFVFEDIEKQGFKDKVYVAYLKAKTPSKLTLTFTEKRRSTRVRTSILMASEIPTERMDENIELDVPKYLTDMNIYASDIVIANKLFADKKIVSIFRNLKNIDTRGYPFLSIGIINGMVTLEFYSEESFRPNLFMLRSDLATIEDYLERLIVVVRKLKSIS